MMTEEKLIRMFTFIPLPPQAHEQVGALRASGLDFAKEILKRVPDGPHQDAAIMHVFEASMLANAGIAFATEVPTPKP